MIGSGKKCPSCGGTVAAGRETCQNCGASFSAQVLEFRDVSDEDRDERGRWVSGIVDAVKETAKELVSPREPDIVNLLGRTRGSEGRKSEARPKAEAMKPVWIGQLPFTERVDHLERALLGLSAAEFDC